MGLLGAAYLLQFCNTTVHVFFFGKHGDITGPTTSMILTALGSVFGGYLGYRFTYLFLFASIAFFASYAIVRGASLFIGGFPSEVDLLWGLYSNEDMPGITFAQLVYSFAILSLWITITLKQLAAVSKQNEKAKLEEQI